MVASFKPPSIIYNVYHYLAICLYIFLYNLAICLYIFLYNLAICLCIFLYNLTISNYLIIYLSKYLTIYLNNNSQISRYQANYICFIYVSIYISFCFSFYLCVSIYPWFKLPSDNHLWCRRKIGFCQLFLFLTFFGRVVECSQVRLWYGSLWLCCCSFRLCCGSFRLCCSFLRIYCSSFQLCFNLSKPGFKFPS